MIPALSLVIKATLIMLIALVVTRAARRARAAVRHAILLATFAILLALPAMSMVLPAIELPILPVALSPATDSVRRASPDNQARTIAAPSSAPSVAASAPAPASPADREWSFTTTSMIAFVWAVGAAVMLASLAFGVFGVQRLRRSALPFLEVRPVLASLAHDARIGRTPDVTVHEDIAAPVTCGVTRQTIVFPHEVREWDGSAVSRALIHELEHCRRHDWATQVSARAICALYWFHPLAWAMYRQLCLEAEHASDDAVVAREESTTYAEQLVTLARRMAARPAIAALGMAQRSDLSDRVHAVLDATRARGRAGLARTSLVTIGALALLLLVSPLQGVAALTGREGAQLRTEAPVNDTRSPRESSSTPRRDASSPREDASSPPEDGTAPSDRVESLVEQGQSLMKQVRPSRLDVALVEAAADGDVDDVRRLVDTGANVNAVVMGDGSPLIAAAREGHIDVVRYLIDRGADVNLPVEGDGAPLIMAARDGRAEIVELLLDRGADIELMSPSDENALIQASAEGHLEIVKLLVARGANVNARTWVERSSNRGGEWRSPLSMATQGRHADVVDYLRSVGATQ